MKKASLRSEQHRPTLPITPAADTNVMKLTANTLFVRPAYGNLYGGRRSMSWWATIMFYCLLVAFTAIVYPVFLYAKETGFHGDYADFCITNLNKIVGIPLLVFICCLWMFIPWRRQLPILFNRRTQTVVSIVEGKLVSCEWKWLHAYLTMAMDHPPLNQGGLTLFFPSNFAKRIGIKATEDAPTVMKNGDFYGAAMIWEYIRRYMQNGPYAVPPPAHDTHYVGTSIRDCVQYLNPWMPFVHRVWWKLLIAIVLAPVLVPFLTCVLVGDITYMLLDRVLPRRQWPQALIDACDGVWDGKEIR